jgi:hypothetical protein
MSAEDSDVSPRRAVSGLLRELYFNRTGLLFLLMLLLSTGLLGASAKAHGSAASFLLTLGTSILATTGYSIVQVFLTTRQLDLFLRSSIQSSVSSQMSLLRSEVSSVVSQVSQAANTMLEKYRELHREFVPIAQYPPVNSPDPRFNNDLNSSIRKSAHYTFRGTTAHHSVARLAQLPSIPPQIQLIIADPTKPAAVDLRARRLVEIDQIAFDQARETVVNRIFISLFGAYAIRSKCDRIEVCLTSSPHIDRLEICDDAIYVTRFSESEEEAFKFPSAVKLSNESQIYKMFARDCSRLLSSPYSVKFEIPREGNDDDFLTALSKVGIRANLALLNSWREGYSEFRTSVASGLVPPTT